MNFDKLPSNARMWIFPGDRELNSEEQNKLNLHMDRFITSWQAHKRDLVAAWSLKYARFIIVGIDENALQASGCSIDSLVSAVREFENQIGCRFVGTHSLIFFRDQKGDIQSVSRPEFKRLVQTGEVTEETIVFDNTVQDLRDFLENRWELMMRDSWHMRAFAPTSLV